MVRQVLIRDLGSTESWVDISSTVVEDSPSLRDGFGSLGSASLDIGKLSLKISVPSLAQAALYQTTQKQVQMLIEGIVEFEGYTADTAAILIEERTDYVFVSLSVYPYSKAFDKAIMPTDLTLRDMRICDESDVQHSLVHFLFQQLYANLPYPFPSILGASTPVTATAVKSKTLPLVTINKGKNILNTINDLLYQNGLAFYMHRHTAIIIEPYQVGRTPSAVLPITSVVSNPSLSQKPYVIDQQCKLRFPTIESIADEQVFKLNEEETIVDVANGAYYPEDGKLIVDYTTEKAENDDDIELVLVEDPVLSFDSASFTDYNSALYAKQAFLRLLNATGSTLQLKNIWIHATAWYRKYKAFYLDSNLPDNISKKEVDGDFIPDKTEAEKFLAVFKSELLAEKTSLVLKTDENIAPNTLIQIEELPYYLLVRSRTRLLDGLGLFQYECVAYSFASVIASTGNTAKTPAPKITPPVAQPGDKVVVQYALGDADGPSEVGSIIGYGGYVLALNSWVVQVGPWVTDPPTPAEGQYVWMRIGTYNPSTAEAPEVWKVSRLTGTKGADGADGAPARTITLVASQTVINMSSRGELKTQQIEITCIPSNLPIEGAVWTASDVGSLSQIEISEGVYDPYKRVLDCSLVTGDSTLISVTITYEGETYTGIVGITKVAEGIPTPMYLEALSVVPTLTSDGPLIVGDFFLYVGPYSGPNTDPGNQGLNPPALEINEFVYGRIYEYKGKNSADVDQWQESRKSSHLAAAQKDALQIAKDSNTYMFVAVLVAQLGLFFDLIVAGILSSPNYAENASGVPTAGFKIDGVKGLIKALGLEAYEAMIYGNLEASGFRTLQEEAGTSISPASVTPTLWKHSEMEALIADQDSLSTLSGTVDGYSFTKAARRTNRRILLGSHGYESESISAGERHEFTKIYPSFVFGPTFRCLYSGYYEGFNAIRLYCRPNAASIVAYLDSMSTSYSRERTYTLDLAAGHNCFFVTHLSTALFGNRSSHVNYNQVWTEQVFTGLVLVNADTSYRVIPFEPTAYYPNTKTWTIGSVTQADKDNYCSGTAFYDLFSGLAIGADGFCDGGQINVNGTLYTVTRLTKNANSITFYTSGGVVTVNKFQEGTSVGVYTELAVTVAINFQAVAGGIEVKHIFPWGTQAGSPGTYDIGTANERFNTAWLNILDVLNAVRFRSTLQVDGVASVASINTGGLGAFLIGQNLRPSDSPTFAGLTVGTINTGYGDNEVFKISNEGIAFGNVSDSLFTKQIGGMNIGDIKFVYTSGTLVGSSNDYTARLMAPAGGSFVVVCIPPKRATTGSTYGYTSGGGQIWFANNDNEDTTSLISGTIIRRIS